VQNPVKTRFRDVVYHTGDLVTLDERGDYLFLGRVDHQIKSRGYRIELGEIEAALYQHPGVREAVALAIPDELVGNRIRAVVALVGGLEVAESALQAHCATLLPRYMIPERVEVRERLPRTPNGKVDRRELIGSPG
jgi:acyl-coenzyme A synthetase/AMP-(fatty) acid ligase